VQLLNLHQNAELWERPSNPRRFRLLKGEDALSDYQFGSNSMHHLFCRNCGVRPFGRGHLDVLGGDFYRSTFACLDGVDAAQLAALPVRYMDGRNNNWYAPPAETRHL